MTPSGPANGALPATSAGSAPFTELDARRLGPVRRYFVQHPVAMDWIVSAVVVLLTVGGTWPNGTAAWWQFGLTLVSAAILLGRRRWPVSVAVAVAVVTAVTLAICGASGVGEFALAFACYAVAASRPPTTAWLTVTGVMSAYAGAVLLWQRGMGSVTVTTVSAETESSAGVDTVAKAVTIVAALMLAVIALAIGASVRSRRLHLADLVGRANALARERDQEGQIAAARERTRIAREMHDVVAHSLTVMITLADGAKATPDRELAATALDELTATGRAALTDMRRVLGVLREDGDVPLSPHDPEETLDEIVEPFRTAGLPVRIVRSGPPVTLPSNVRHAAHRIVAEALTNVLRYAPLAPVTEVRVHERHEDTGTWLDIQVFNVAGPSGAGRTHMGTGHGIIGMKERAAMYGGTASAGPTATGWQVSASLRIPEPDPGEGAQASGDARAWPW